MFNRPGKTILMHNRRGVRIELNFDQEGRVELWISPRAGESRDQRDRNFSCRDDFTRIFDAITLPGLTAKEFVACDYDPFYSVLRFRRQTLHVLTRFAAPVVLLWLERPGCVDFKSDKQDRVLRATPRVLAVEHPDRGYRFEFVATAGPGAHWEYRGPRVPGRSAYGRVHLAAGAGIAIAGELAGQPVARWARVRAREQEHRVLERALSRALAAGRFELRDPKLQRLLDLNRRVLLAMQDESGAIRAAINLIYYLIWVRDGAMVTAYQAYAGNAAPVRRWTEFLLANPTVIESEQPHGRTFLQLVGPITKWEEDGVFYAIWSVFTAWTQTGDACWLAADKQALLREAMDWLERRCLNRRLGLFGRFFAGESPFAGCRDAGFDGAVGKPGGESNRRWRGRLVQQAFDLYINLGAYAAYWMLAAMGDDSAARKAEGLGRRLEKCFGKGLPAYGWIKTHDGKLFRAGSYGLDAADYQWALTVPPFLVADERLPEIRRQLLADLAKKDRYFLAAYCAILGSLDLEFVAEREIWQAMQLPARQSYRPGQSLPMPNTVIEMTNVPDGHPWHDVRPQAFSIAPWLAAVTGLGLRRLPFGLAVRSPKLLRRLRDYEYRGARLDVDFTGRGPVTINGRLLIGSLQLPERWLRPGRNRIIVGHTRGPALVSSTVRLLDVANGRYEIEAYGKNVLTFRHEPRLSITDAQQQPVRFTVQCTGQHTWVRFAGRGQFTVQVKM